jgi:hypothetical protein
MEETVSHDRGEETPEAKTRWYRSLSLHERMEIFVAVTDLALTINPRVAETKHTQPIKGRVRVLSLEDMPPIE